LQVKLTGTPNAPHTHQLGLVRRREADLPGPSISGAREVARPAGEFFASTRLLRTMNLLQIMFRGLGTLGAGALANILVIVS